MNEKQSSLFEFLNDKLKECSTEALRNTACLVTFSSSRFGEDVKDDELAAELAIAHNTSSANINVTKKRFAGSLPELVEMEKFVKSVYNKHRKMTKSYKKRGAGILWNSKIPEYIGVMAECSNRLETLRTACRAALPQAHARAKAKLGSAYKESDYADLATIPDRFMIHFELEPIPDSEDLNMPDGFEQLQLRGLYEGVRARFARAIEGIWKDIYAGLKEANEKAQEKDVKRWHGSLLTNVTNKVTELKEFGLIDDAAFNAVLDDLDTTFATFDIKRVAGMLSERERLVEQTKRLMAAMDNISSSVGMSSTSDDIEVIDDAEPAEVSCDEAAQLIADNRDLYDDLMGKRIEEERADVPCVDELEEVKEEPKPAPLPVNPTMEDLMKALLSGG